MPSTARVGLGVAAIALAIAGTVVTAQPANAKADTTCQRAGIARSRVPVCSTRRAGGLPIAPAVALGVTPRAGTDVSTLPDPLPLSVVLADHRAGDHAWCLALVLTHLP